MYETLIVSSLVNSSMAPKKKKQHIPYIQKEPGERTEDGLLCRARHLIQRTRRYQRIFF